ncbi:HNH endonuclease [Mumia sp. Pv 4-285]|uniref:HNH endonuclease n=1 Tax=Mumia qirimensis TaxID=3234852 RepID=UPI00351CE0AA
MFDSGRYAALGEAFDAVAAMPVGLADSAQTRAALRDLQSISDRVEGLRASLLDHMDASGAFADEGASSTLSWARRELRLSDATTKRLRAAGHTMRTLPGVGDAMLAGEIRLEHVAHLTSGLRRIDPAVFADATEHILLPLAKQAAPSDLAQAIDRLDEVTHPEKLDEAWKRGMDKRDVQVSRAGDGYHLAGFVDVVLGAKLKAFLVAASAPRGPSGCEGEGDGPDVGAGGGDGDRHGAARRDERSPSQRRTDALHDLMDAVIADGLRGDKGFRPQLHVTVDAEWLARQPGAAPPTLSGFGPIGPDLYAFLACGGDHTAILTGGTTDGPTPYAAVLSVGRTRRLATRTQRTAVRVRQGGFCANPGCRNTHVELHHVAWWKRDGGRTDLDNLAGLCRACHMAVHAGRLHVEPDGRGGFVFRRTLGSSRRVIEDRERRQRRRLRDYLRGLSAARDGAVRVGVVERPAAAMVVGPHSVGYGAPTGTLERHRDRHTTSPRT